MKILVTGGSGFLGSRLISKLVRADHQVFALARSPSSDDKVRALAARRDLGYVGHVTRAEGLASYKG